MNGRILKVAHLEQVGACEDQVELFRKTFGEAVLVTVQLAESVADLFDISWAAQKLLRAPEQVEFARVRDSARKIKHGRVCDEVRAKYRRVLACEFARLYILEGQDDE